MSGCQSARAEQLFDQSRISLYARDRPVSFDVDTPGGHELDLPAPAGNGSVDHDVVGAGVVDLVVDVCLVKAIVQVEESSEDLPAASA